MDTTIFIGAIIAGVTEGLKGLSPKITSWVTVVVAALVGLVIALVDTQIGLNDISVAQGILTGLSAAGVVGVAKKVG